MTLPNQNKSPTTNDFKIALTEDTKYTFKVSDFPFFDIDVGQSLKFVKFTGIFERGGSGGIYLRGTKIKQNQEISIEDIVNGLLVFVPEKNASGEESSYFSFAVSDGLAYSPICVGSFNIAPVEDAPILNSTAGKQILFIGNDKDNVVEAYPIDSQTNLIALTTHHYENERAFYTVKLQTSNSYEQEITTTAVQLAYEFSSNIHTINALNDGKYLAARPDIQSTNTFVPLLLSKFNHDGAIDRTWGENGTSAVTLTHNVVETRMIAQLNGAILIATKGVPSRDAKSSTIELDRLNSDGSTDKDFHRFNAASLAKLGALVVADPLQNETISTLPNGKMLIFGRNYYTNEIVVVRLLEDGAPDYSFGTASLAHLKTTDRNIHPIAITNSIDGSSFVLSQYIDPYGGNATISVTKLNKDGLFDMSFNKTGVLTLTNDDVGLNLGLVKNLLMTNDQKLLVSTNAFTPDFPNDYDGKKIMLIRIEQDGRFDQTFNKNGIVTFSVEGNNNSPIHLTSDLDGKITVTATSNSNTSDKYVFFARFNQDGSVDNSFARANLSENNLSQGVILDRHLWILDPEIYSRTGDQPSFTIHRANSADPEDLFFFPEKFIVEHNPFKSSGGKIYKYDQLIATYSVDNGTLKLTFNGLYTYPDILDVIRNIRYSNAQAGPERVIALHWTMDEGVKGVSSIGETQTEVLVGKSTNSIPTGKNIDGSLQPFSNHIFSLDEFNFHDRDGADRLTGISIISVPSHRGLFLNNNEVKIGDFITSEDIAKGLFRFRSLDLSDGAFAFALSDGKGQSIPYSWNANVRETIEQAPELFAINGSYKHGEVLKAELKSKDIGDPSSITYQWYVNGFANSKLNHAEMLPTSFDLGANIEVIVRYQDINGNQKTLKSVGALPIQVGNDAAAGTVIFSGRGIVGETLEYGGGVYDGDGISSLNGVPNLQFQWRVDGIEIPGATNSKLLLSPEFSGKKITLDINYIDLKGKQESISGGLHYPINDVITFSEGNNKLVATPGDNLIVGSSGDDTIIINQPLRDFVILKATSGFYVLGKASEETHTSTLHTLQNVEHIQFQNLSVNLTITDKAKQIPKQQVNSIIELYIAFFNRIPDADGLSYWLDQLNKGQSVLQIADSFYQAGAAYPELTGFSRNMSHEDFINVVYKNTLGRITGADQEGLTYWSSQLKSGQANYASLVAQILNSAHNFKGDKTWGWVADLLDNKVSVGSKVAVDWGISFNSPEESIRKGMEVITAVTPTNYWDAIKLLGIATDTIYLQ